MSDEYVGIVELREQAGRLVDNAHFRGECTVITKNGEPRAVVVPYEWYREAESRREELVRELRDQPRILKDKP